MRRFVGNMNRFICFRNGQPQDTRLPLDLVSKATSQAVTSSDFLQYGPSAGDLQFRRDLSKFLSSMYKCNVPMERLFVTAGVSHGVGLVARKLLNVGDIVLVENPTYFLVSSIFDDCPGVRVVGVKTCDENGLDLEHLQQLCDEHGDKIRLLYTIPVHNNPRGVTLSHESREQLVCIAQKYRFTILADEVYQILSFCDDRPPPPPLCSYDKDGDDACVVSVSSFSKILCPGLRVGWLETRNPRIFDLVENDGVIVSGGCISHLATAIAMRVINDTDFIKYIQSLNVLYRHRCSVLTNAIREYLPGARFVQPFGGYFVWLRFDNVPQKSIDKLKEVMKDNQLRVLFGNECYVDDGDVAAPVEMRLCFARLEDEDLREGVKRLADCVNSINK